MNTAQRIIKNTLSLLFSGLVSQLFIFCTMIYLARILGPQNFGKISFATALIAYFTLVTHLGLPLLGTREIAKNHNDISFYFSNIIFLRISLAVLSFVLLLLLSFFLPKSLELKQLILLYGLGLFFSALRIDWVFQGVEKMEFIGLSRILSASVFFGLTLLFVKNANQLLWVPCFHIFGSLLAALALFAIFFKTYSKLKFKIDFKLCKKIFRHALPLGISILLIEIIYSIDTVMLGFMRTDAEVGYYNAAYKIIMPIIMIGSVYLDAVFPVISNYFKTSFSSLQNIQNFNAKIMVLFALPISFGGSFLAVPIMNLIYGSIYDKGAGAFKILIWTVVFIYTNSVFARGLWACNKQKAFLIIVVFQAVINIVLNFFLIPGYGIYGASISTVLSELAGLSLYYREFNKVTFVSFYQHIPKPFIASIIMLTFIIFIKTLNLVLLVSGSCIIYFLALYLIKGISNNDIRSIGKAVGFFKNREHRQCGSVR